MRSNSFYLALILSVIAIAVGCNANKVTKIGQATPTQKPGPETQYADGAPRITIPDLQKKIENKQVFIVDVRNQASYDAGHIPDSKLIPSGEILNHLDELPKDKLIVTYCS